MARRLGDGAGLIPRLLVATAHAPLTWLVIPLGCCPGPDLYSRPVNACARDLAAEIVGKAPAWCVLQRGRNGGLHINVIMDQQRWEAVSLPYGEE